MYFATGDTHGDFNRLIAFSQWAHPTKDDVLIVLGDAALNFSLNDKDRARKDFVSSFPFITFCIHGNHEARPDGVSSYITKAWHGGDVMYEEEYSNILFAVDGEIYDFDGLSCVAIGGAYSIDKPYRLAHGLPWFPDEQPDDETKRRVEENLAAHGDKVDIVLSHTCPYRYMPIETFISDIDQSKVDKSTEIWLGDIEERLDYRRWYCGHYHINKSIDRVRFMYGDIEELQVPVEEGGKT